MKLLNAISRHSQHLADKPALIDDYGTITYRELAESIVAFATKLHHLGAKPGAAVALAIEPNTPGVVILLGTIAAGALAAPVNTRLAAPEIVDYLGRIKPALALVDPRSDAEVPGALRLDALYDDAPLAHRLGLPAADSGSLADLPGPAPAVALPTGGTTGVPKAALWSRAGLSAITISNCIHLGVERADRELYISPLFHITIVSGLLPTLYVGGTVRLSGRFDADVAATIFRDLLPTRMLTTPTAFSWIVQRLGPSDRYAELATTVVYGAARNSPDFRENVLRTLPRTRLITGYGATEHGPVARLYPTEPEADLPGALGRPVAEARIKAVNPGGEPVSIGEVGELLVAAPWQMLGYLGGADSPFAPDGSIHSGDLGWLDPNGCLFLAGRSKEMIKTGGENVFPSEVEQVLHRHPAITDVGVYGVEDDVWGERVEAALVVDAGKSIAPPDGATLKAFCAEHLASYKIPKRFRFVEVIPYTANMKVDRRQLVIDATSGP